MLTGLSHSFANDHSYKRNRSKPSQKCKKISLFAVGMLALSMAGGVLWNLRDKLINTYSPVIDNEIYHFNAIDVEPKVVNNQTYGFSSLEELIPSSSLSYIDTSLSLTSPASWVKKVNAALEEKSNVRLIEKGMSASYLIRGANDESLAIFKPSSQAGGAPNNFKGFNVTGWGINNPEIAAIKEYGARIVAGEYLGVPDIYLVRMKLNGKIEQGSLQKYIPNKGTLRDLFGDFDLNINNDLKSFSDLEKRWKFILSNLPDLQKLINKIDGAAIQKMGVLDLIIQNSDRREDNVLYTGDALIPIDHNIAFPEKFVQFLSFPVWLMHPAAFLPLDSEVVEYVQKMDIEKIKKQLYSIGMGDIKIFYVELMCIFVKKAVSLNFTLFEMGQMLFVNNYRQSSLADVWDETANRNKFLADPFERFKWIFDSMLSFKMAKMKEASSVQS